MSVNWVSIGSGNGLSPARRQAITWTNAGLLSIGHLGTNCSEIRIEIQKFSFMKMHLNLSPAKWRPFCPGEGELIPGPWPTRASYCPIELCWYQLNHRIIPVYIPRSLGWPPLTPTSGTHFTTEILWKSSLVRLWSWQSSEVLNLYMSWDLSCHDMSKIVIWLDQYVFYIRATWFLKGWDYEFINP